MRNNRSKVVMSVMAAMVATSVVAAGNPVDAATSSTKKAEEAVVKAEKLGAALKKEISLDYRKTTYPKNLVGIPNMKLFNDTKKALADARKSVSGLKGKEKTVLSSRLDANVALYITRTATFIDAVNAGVKIQKKNNDLTTLTAKGIVNDRTEALYDQLNDEIKKNTPTIEKVYGDTARTQFKAYYIQPAVNQLNNLLFPITIKMEIDHADKALNSQFPEEAAQTLGNVDYYLREAAKKGQKGTNKLIIGSLAKQKAVLDRFNKTCVLYIAKSSPITIGPDSGNQTISKKVYIYTGVNEQLTLQNVSIGEDLVVLGSPVGAGSVYLENVKTTAGKINVVNVGNQGLHLKNSQVETVLVNDEDASTIVIEKGSKINRLQVSVIARDVAKAILESQESGAINSVLIAANGSYSSQGTELKGNFSKTTVSITGENEKLSLANGTEVGRMEINGAGRVTIPTTSKVSEMVKGPKVNGDIYVYNDGTIEIMQGNMLVSGNAPHLVMQANDANDSEPLIEKLLVKTNSDNDIEAAYDKSSNTFTASLVNLKDSDRWTGFILKASKAEKFRLNSAKGTPGSLVSKKTFPIEFPITNRYATITTKEIWGDDLLSMGFQRIFTETLILKGNLIGPNNQVGKEITIFLKYK